MQDGGADATSFESPREIVGEHHVRYGFALTKMNLPFETTSNIAEMAETMLEPFPLGEYPNLADFITEIAMKPGYDYGNEFEYGLDVILDGLARATT
jgi:hypothetical protein